MAKLILSRVVLLLRESVLTDIRTAFTATHEIQVFGNQGRTALVCKQRLATSPGHWAVYLQVPRIQHMMQMRLRGKKAPKTPNPKPESSNEKKTRDDTISTTCQRKTIPGLLVSSVITAVLFFMGSESTASTTVRNTDKNIDNIYRKQSPVFNHLESYWRLLFVRACTAALFITVTLAFVQITQ